MVRISLDLLRKRCEHNDGLIHNLEELSLHQDNLEEIDNVDKWCRDLKILYLQGNTIHKIENLNRLKSLEYLNLALNNIERIENLNRCESLRKLDLTANFIGDLTSVENLKNNIFLEELFLTGNPCTEFTGYRDYVIAALPQLLVLDGQNVHRTDRIVAVQNFTTLKSKIIPQQTAYANKRKQDKSKNATIMSTVEEECGDGQERWENMSWSPEYRVEMAKKRMEIRDEKNKSHSGEEKSKPPECRLFDSNDKPLNINQLKTEFTLDEDVSGGRYVLNVLVYRYLNTSLIDVKLEPAYVRITVKGKILQMRLEHEISPDKSTVRRSTTTGSLKIVMAFAGDEWKQKKREVDYAENTEPHSTTNAVSVKPTFLEVDPKVRKSVDINIFGDSSKRAATRSFVDNRPSLGRPDSPGFCDDSEVPPLQ